MIKRLVVALAAGAVVLGAVTAFAASMNVTTTTLGASSATVSACNSAAAATYAPTYSATAGGYVVNTVTVTTSGSLSGCGGMSFQVTLTDSSGASLAEYTGTLAANGAGTSATPASPALAKSVAGVQVVITG